MTLTSSPCELDNMSLFQDLKLKRRKVDSRCSSDGKKFDFFPPFLFFLSRSTTPTHLSHPSTLSPSSLPLLVANDASRVQKEKKKDFFFYPSSRRVTKNVPSSRLFSSTRALTNNTPLSFFKRSTSSEDHGLIFHI